MGWFENKRVVVPWDFSDLAREALEIARQITGQPQRLHLIFVSAPIVGVDPMAAWSALDEAHIREQSTQSYLEAVGGQAELKDAQFEVRFGDPGSEIVRYADEVQADLIVMSSHGRTGLQRLMIGSVAERVVRLAHCPVLILRRRPEG